MATDAESILRSTKKVLGLDPSYDAFDLDVTMHINSALATLTQLGIGPEDGFAIDDDQAVWGDFLTGVNRVRLNSVKTYVYLKVRSVFDPPATSFALDAMKQQIQELEWRINVVRESTDWVDPDPTSDSSPLVIDGGTDG